MERSWRLSSGSDRAVIGSLAVVAAVELGLGVTGSMDSALADRPQTREASIGSGTGPGQGPGQKTSGNRSSSDLGFASGV